MHTSYRNAPLSVRVRCSNLRLVHTVDHAHTPPILRIWVGFLPPFYMSTFPVLRARSRMYFYIHSSKQVKWTKSNQVNFCLYLSSAIPYKVLGELDSRSMPFLYQILLDIVHALLPFLVAFWSSVCLALMHSLSKYTPSAYCIDVQPVILLFRTDLWYYHDRI
jgi:hypothetical protein